MIESAEARQDTLVGCDVWNYFFTRVTGVEGPNVEKGCYGAKGRGEKVSLEQWFRWLEGQR